MAADNHEAGPPADRKLVLIVDDEFDFVEIYETLFRLHGYDVQVATNGREALELARTTAPDLVLSDYMMPVMDGVQLLLAWRADPQLRHIPFILNSAGKNLQDTPLPFDAFFTKPARFPLVLEAVRKLTQAK